MKGIAKVGVDRKVERKGLYVVRFLVTVWNCHDRKMSLLKGTSDFVSTMEALPKGTTYSIKIIISNSN